MADLEDALKKLDRLTQEEARMALAEVLRISHSICDDVEVVDGKVERVEGKVAVMGDKLQCVDGKVQVVIDGTRGRYSQLPISSNMYTSRKQAGKRGGERSKLNYSPFGERHRRNQVFVTSRRFVVPANLTRREPVETAPASLDLSHRSIHEPQHCTKGSTQRNGSVALSRNDLHGMEVYWFPLMDPRKACVSVIIFRACVF